jgi:outer membrane receptor for monomeric catechols
VEALALAVVSLGRVKSNRNTLRSAVPLDQGCCYKVRRKDFRRASDAVLVFRRPHHLDGSKKMKQTHRVGRNQG